MRWSDYFTFSIAEYSTESDKKFDCENVTCNPDCYKVSLNDQKLCWFYLEFHEVENVIIFALLCKYHKVRQI